MKNKKIIQPAYLFFKSIHPIYLFFIALIFTYLGSTLQSGIFNNFAVEKLNIKPSELGIYESIRESPGIVILFIIPLLMFLQEQYIAALSTLIMAAGYFCYGFVTKWNQLLLIGFIGSLGLHIHLPLSNTIALYLAKENYEGKMLGFVQRMSFIGQFLAMAFIIVLGKIIPYKLIFIFSSISLLLASIFYFILPKTIGIKEKPKIVLRKKYWLYYVLTFLEGCRKQIFITFAIFVLVKVYKISVQTTAILLLINSIMVILVGPTIGKLVDRYSEKKVLFISYFLVIFVFLGYAFIHNLYLLIICYTLDNILYLANISLTYYVNKIADKKELRLVLSTGVAMNHIAAVLMPFVGGLIWIKLGYELVFIIGGIVVIISLIFVTLIKSKRTRGDSNTQPSDPQSDALST